MAEFEFIGPNDKPALMAIASPELQSVCETVLKENEYKVHAASTHDDLLARFGQVQYKIVIIEDKFGGEVGQNTSLQNLQARPMAERRHAFFTLIGDQFESFNERQAFAASVHVVLNPKDIIQAFPQVLQQKVAENDLFLKRFFDVQAAVMQGQ